MIGALKFYGDKDNWFDLVITEGSDRRTIWKDTEEIKMHDRHICFAGKRARTVLAKVDELMKEINKQEDK